MYSSYDSFYDEAAIFGGVLFFVLMAILIAVLVVYLVALAKVFKKAGKPGWAAIVPFYSNWVLVEVAGLNWWWFLLLIASSISSFFDLEEFDSIISLVVLFAQFNCFFNISKRFNKGTGFAICTTLFSGICIPILGFSKNCQYNHNIPVSPNGVFGNADNSNNMNNASMSSQPDYNQQPVYNQEPVNPQPVQNTDVNIQPQNMNNDVVNNVANDAIFCSNCGSKSNANNKFCQNCGKEIIK